MVSSFGSIEQGADVLIYPTRKAFLKHAVVSASQYKFDKKSTASV